MSLINVTNLTFAYDGSYDNIFENVSFQIDTDWKLAFTGRNGRGKTTFLNLLLGKSNTAEIFLLMSVLNITLSMSKTRKIIPLM
jgi:ATPase subunit of ABC transporter with duplicated ATPase domains